MKGHPRLKSGAIGSFRRRRGRQPAELVNAIEGQIAELCRDLAVEAKRMRHLQEQADELRAAIQRCVSPSNPDAEIG